jgi:hypothetical protein
VQSADTLEGALALGNTVAAAGLPLDPATRDYIERLNNKAATHPERQLATTHDWAVASDGLQWILQRRAGESWEAVSFVRTTRDMLAEIIREHNAPVGLLSGSPETFDSHTEARQP